MSQSFKTCRKRYVAWVFLTAALTTSSSAWGQGIALRGISAVNSSMGGAATACPLDAAGALHWNPATISGLSASEISFGMEMILPSTSVSSTAGPFSGTDSSEPGVIPVPNMAFVHRDPDSLWSWGIGIYGIGGSAVNYSASNTNPILFPQSSGGLGQLAANVDILQVAPTLSYQLDEHWSFGFGPTLTMGKLYATPLFLGPKFNDEWAAGVGTRYVWGGGCQAGLFCKTDSGWNYGASIKSPQWIEPFRYKSQDNDGNPVTITFDMDYPLIASFGTAYTGFEKWIFACDLRYFDYSNTPGFRHVGFSDDGAAQGLQWNSIMSVSLGAQRQVTDRLTARVGYCFNENPIDSNAAQTNVASPLIIMHTLNTGISYMFEHDWLMSLTYTHCFQNSVTGPLHNASGRTLGTVTSTTAADTVSMGITKRF